jgi:hypothetical protein
MPSAFAGPKVRERPAPPKAEPQSARRVTIKTNTSI